MGTKNTAPALLAAAALAASCSIAPGAPVDFCVDQARAYCDLQYRCCSAIERRQDPYGLFAGPATRRRAPSTAGECTDVLAELCRGALAGMAEALEEERIAYDVDEAVDCLEELRGAVDQCDPGTFFDAQGTFFASLIDTGQPGILGDACKSALHGTVEEGDDCFAPYECEEGTCAVDASGDDVTIEGECVGTEELENPFEEDVEFEICDGLEDEGPA